MSEAPDSLRCRYEDCVEQHPIAEGGHQVTCPTCRQWMGLPPLDDDD